MPRLTLLFCAALLLAGAAVMAQETAVTSQEIKDNWTGRTLPGVLPNGSSVTVHFKADGTINLAGAVTDTGSWRVSENGYCTTWKKIRAGQERCFTAIRKGGKVDMFNPDGSLSGTFTEPQ